MTYTTGEAAKAVLEVQYGMVSANPFGEGKCWFTILNATPSGIVKESELDAKEPDKAGLTCSPAFKRIQLTKVTGHGKLTTSVSSNKCTLETVEDVTIISEITAGTFEAKYFAIVEDESKAATGRITGWGALSVALTLSTATWPVKLPANKLVIILE